MLAGIDAVLAVALVIVFSRGKDSDNTDISPDKDGVEAAADDTVQI